MRSQESGFGSQESGFGIRDSGVKILVYLMRLGNAIFQNYLYVNELMLSCQKVAVNISPTLWQEIEDRMLRVP
ncbi:hypothetical protein MAN88_16260 [Microcystis aeruginosa]|nr:hypothetical protein MAN88_16260 [Microcystis aeruginosa]